MMETFSPLDNIAVHSFYTTFSTPFLLQKNANKFKGKFEIFQGMVYIFCIMKKILLKDIAEKLGVSVSQASRALNDREYVAPELRRKAVQLAKSLNYRNMSWKHRKRIAVIINSFSDFNINLLTEIRALAQKKQCDTAIIPIENINQLNDQIFDGAFIISCSAFQVKWNEKFRIPLVVINHYGDITENISEIFPDADQEIRVALEHFIRLGHRRIARIRFQGTYSTEREQQRGVNELIRISGKHGLEEPVINVCVSDFDEMIKKVLELSEEGCTAFLLVMSDYAPYLLKALYETGKRIPEDISVITYECGLSALQTPPLTTLQYDYCRIVEAAFEQLFKEMKEEPEYSRIMVPGKLILRASTAPVPANKKN